MRERRWRPPAWLIGVLGERIREDAFEPAFDELLARHLESRARRAGAGRWLMDVGFRLRASGLVLECLRLERQRGPRAGPGRMEWLRRDTGYALRGLARRPGFTVVAVLTLALGIGANTAIFSVVNGTLLRSLPFLSPAELVTMEVTGPQGYGISVSVPNHRDWQARNRTLASVGMAAGWRMTYTAADGAEVLQGRIVFGDFFETLGVAPLRGRWITADETDRGAQPVAVLGHGFWQRAFAGDPAAVGRTMRLGSQEYVIVGVMPPGFGMPTPEVEVYVPMGTIPGLPWEDRASSFGASAFARLAPGATVEAAQRDLDRIMLELAELEGRPVGTVLVRTMADSYTRDARQPLLILFGAVAFILLIAGVNVANLLLARGEERRQEIVMRTALGASRGAIVRQLLAESMVVALAGAVLGLGLAWIATALMRDGLPMPRLLAEQIALDVPVLVFTALVTVAVGIGFGLLPAWRASGAAAELKQGARGTPGRSSQRIRSVLVVTEIALALVLLVGAGLMLASLSRLRASPAGFDPDRVLTAWVSTPQGAAPDSIAWLGFWNDLLENVRATPGVRSASASLLIPLSPRSWELLLTPEGQPWIADEGESVLYNQVSSGYFETMGIPLLRGRDFAAADHNDAQFVVIVDETLAAKYWPGEDPIGRRITFERRVPAADADPVPVYRTIVGVVPNVRHYDMREPSRIQVWVPMQQSRGSWGNSMFLAVKTAGPPAALAGPLREAVRAVNRATPMSFVQPLDQYVAADLATDRALGGLLTAFGALAASLAAIGVFGVMSLAVATRRREIGLRLAVGARPPQLVAMVLRRSLLLAAVGAAVGLVAAGALTRLLATILYEISPLDPAVLALATLILVGIAAIASLVPAVRAARVDPVRTLRQEA